MTIVFFMSTNSKTPKDARSADAQVPSIKWYSTCIQPAHRPSYTLIHLQSA